MKKSILSALAALSLSAPVLAADYYVVVPLPGKVAASAPEIPDPVENITVTLNAYALPAGMVNTPYSFDLNAVLDVQGDAAYDAADVAWSVVDGATPEGIALQADGMLAGTPTVKNKAGASFEVKASYKGQDGQQVYTIVVNGASLQVTQIAAGAFHTCALTSSGGVKCWGFNQYGELGDGTTTTRVTPVDVVGLSTGVASVTAGQQHTCATMTIGVVKCWGRNGEAQLGDGTTTARVAPVLVNGLSDVTQVHGGGYHTCALTSAKEMFCWGENGSGQLGDGTEARSAVPRRASVSAMGVSAIAIGNYHTCALTEAGAAYCWGYNGYGQIGDGSTTGRKAPTLVSGMASGVAQLSGGEHQTCAVLATGAAKCWGYNGSGRLGDGTLTYRTTPVEVAGLSASVAAIDTGLTHTCAVTTAGEMLCWGNNGSGALGDGTTIDRRTPTQVLNLDARVVAISVAAHTCAALATGDLRCWGPDNYGQVGDGGSNTNQSTPVAVVP